MFVDADGTHTAPTFAVREDTLIFDLARNAEVIRLNRRLVLPVGTEIELTEPNVNATVVGVRLLAGDPALVCLDVKVPEVWWQTKTKV